jgi:hypothetical protein
MKLPLTFLAVAASLPLAAFACSAGTSGSATELGDAATNTTPPETADRDASKGDAAGATCTPCGDLQVAECSSGDFVGIQGCLQDGQCRRPSFEDACRGPHTGGVFTYEACGASDGLSGDVFCSARQVRASCQCRTGGGYEAPRKCVQGFCSASKEDVCPSACQRDGGWVGCRAPIDCRPVICDCKDGYRPVPWTAQCSNGACQTAPAVCPAACGSHGGWAGSGSNTDAGIADSGSNGGGQPGASCSRSSDCASFACGCKDGSAFNGIRACNTNTRTCSTKAEACGFACLSSGGWDGR